MSDEVPAFDAYRPPQGIGAPQSGGGGGRPGGLTAICVIAIVLGALGVCSALMGVVGLAFGRQMQQVFTAPAGAGGDADAAQLQRRMQEDVQAVTERYMLFHIIAVAVQMVVAGCLLIGGIRTLGWRPGGRTMLAGVCGAAIVFELCRGVLQAVMQMEMASVMGRYFEQMMGAAPGGGPGADFVATGMKAALYAGFVFGIGLIVVKVVYYGLAVRYLRKPAIRRLFEGFPPPAELA